MSAVTPNELNAIWPELHSRFALPEYYLRALSWLVEKVDFQGKKVLEIGGSSLPQEVVCDHLGVEQWVSVDLIGHAAGAYQVARYKSHYGSIGIRQFSDYTNLPLRPYLIFDESAAALPVYFEEQFDVCVSINAFEHIGPLGSVLNSCFRSLKVNGALLSIFGPIWSSVSGSHFWINDQFNFDKRGPMPRWGHLLFSEEELALELSNAGISEKIVERVIHQCYRSDFVNRFFFEDYELCLEESDFGSGTVEGIWKREVENKVSDDLSRTYPGRRDFSSYGIKLSAAKGYQPRPQARDDSTVLERMTSTITESARERGLNFSSWRWPKNCPTHLGFYRATTNDSVVVHCILSNWGRDTLSLSLFVKSEEIDRYIGQGRTAGHHGHPLWNPLHPGGDDAYPGWVNVLEAAKGRVYWVSNFRDVTERLMTRICADILSLSATGSEAPS